MEEDGEQEWEGFFLFDARISLSHIVTTFYVYASIKMDGQPEFYSSQFI